MRGYAAVALVVWLDVLICEFWLGPYWFILISAVFCGVYILASMLRAAGDADRRIEAMFDYHVERGDDGRERLVTVPKEGRDTAA